MLSSERQRLIEERAIRYGEISISSLAKELNISVETIRRDVNTLSKQNRIIKVHGGAIPAKRPLRENSYVVRQQTNFEVKRKLGEYAVKFIEDNDVVMLSSGVTIEAMAVSIAGLNNVTFITNSLTTSNILKDKLRNRCFTGNVIVIGGLLNADEHFMYGPIANAQISLLRANKAFIGTSGIYNDDIMITDIEEGAFMSLLIKNSNESYLICENSKIERKSIYKYASLSDINHIITEDNENISSSFRTYLNNANVLLHVL